MAGKFEKRSKYPLDDLGPFDISSLHVSSKNLNPMEDYINGRFDENLALELLSSESKRSDALIYLDSHFQESNSILIFQDKVHLFSGLSDALCDASHKVRFQCTKLIIKIIPQLGPETDKYMQLVLPLIIGNVGSQSVSLQKESIQALYLHMKHSADVFQTLKSIASEGITHADIKTRQQVIHKFPTLLFPDFQHEDFFEIVHSLVANFNEQSIDKDIVAQTLQKVAKYMGAKKFLAYINRLPASLQLLFNEQFITDSSKPNIGVPVPNVIDVVESKQASRLLSDVPPVHKSLSDDQENKLFAHTSRRPGQVSNPLAQEPASMIELGFIPRDIIGKLSSASVNDRSEAVKKLKLALADMNNAAVLKQNIIPLFSLLQPVIDDKNSQVSCSALQVFDVIITKMGPSLTGVLKLFIYAVAKKLGNSKDSVRSELTKVVLHAMEVVGPQPVLDLIWPKTQNRQSKVREDVVNLVIASLLTFSPVHSSFQNEINIEKLCGQLAPLLLDPKPVVRQATLDCFALLAHLLGSNPSSLRPISNAVDQVELQSDNATGIMSAVHARLVRKQLPRLNDKFLVDYAVFPPSTAPATAPQGADLLWVLAAGSSVPKAKIKSSNSSSEKVAPKYEKASVSSEDSVVESPSRRHLSAGKQRPFPWSSNDYDASNSRHPSSAPVKAFRSRKHERPPIVPRTTWGPESTPDNISAQASKMKSNKSPQNSGLTYQELYQRKKVLSGRSPLTQITTSQGSATYKPSFASNNYTGSSSVTSSASQPQESFLSNSCPSTFFEKNALLKPSRNRTMHVDIDDDISTFSDAKVDTPIRLKPTLARSAAKRREVTMSGALSYVASSHQDNHVPAKLKESSDLSTTSSDFTPDKVKQWLKPSEESSALVHPQKTEDSLFISKKHLKNVSESISAKPSSKNTTAYASSFSSPLRSETLVDHDSSLTSPHKSTRDNNLVMKTSSLSDQVIPTSLQRSLPYAFPSDHPPPVKESSDIYSQVSAIRRSAQNKRQRMKSQPADTPDPFQSVERLSSISSLEKKLPKSYRSSVESVPASRSEAPPLKYSPNLGVTFDTNKADSTVSVVGVGMKFGGTSAPSESKHSSPSPSYSISSISATESATKLGFFSSQSSPDKRKPMKGASMGMVSPTNSENGSGSFNIQGKGFFGPSSSSGYSSSFHFSSSKGGSPSPTSTNLESETDRILDGIFGLPIGHSSSANKTNTNDFPSHMVSMSTKHDTLLKNDTSGMKATENKTKNRKVGRFDPSHMSRSMNMTDPGLSCNESSMEPRLLQASLTESESRMDSSSKLGSMKLPVEKPEQSLLEAIKDINTTDPDDWESVASGIFMMGRLATYHQTVLVSRFQEVIRLLSKHVNNLRSQVSRSSVIALADVYSNIRKPVVDTDIEITIGALLTEYGKSNSFMKDEISKTLQSIINSVTSSKFLGAILNLGQKHKNKSIRCTTALFCSQCVDKMGPGKALSGSKDITDRLMEAIASFMDDGSPDVRYYAKHMINELMYHEDFESSLNRFLSPKLALKVKDRASEIKQRGLGSVSSVGSRKPVSSSKLPGSASRLAEQTSQSSSSAPPKRKIHPSRVITDTEYEEIKLLCSDLQRGSLDERRTALTSLLLKAKENPPLIEDNIVKIMDAYCSLLTTANIKLNAMALEILPQFIKVVRDGLKETLVKLIPDVLKLISSKQNCDLALNALNVLMENMDPGSLLPPLVNAAQYGANKSRQVALTKITDVVHRVGPRKMATVERCVLPVLWNLLSTHKNPVGIQLRREVVQLTKTLYHLLGSRLLEHPDSRNVAQCLQEILDND